MNQIKNFLQLLKFVSNEIVGGKIWVMWKVTNDFIVEKMSNQMVSSWVNIKGSKFLVTFIYDKCSLYEHRRLWMEMEQLLTLNHP